MFEGWHEQTYFILFDDVEAARLTEAYGLPTFLPEYVLVGLKNWDDFIVTNAQGDTCTIPTVPAIQQYLELYSFPKTLKNLVPDERLTGKIKWYIKPIVFGGDPQFGDNVRWISIEEHTALVKWWNKTYRLTASSGEGV